MDLHLKWRRQRDREVTKNKGSKGFSTSTFSNSYFGIIIDLHVYLLETGNYNVTKINNYYGESLKLRERIKNFNYTPRHYQGSSEGSPYEIKHKFDDNRKTL